MNKRTAMHRLRSELVDKFRAADIRCRWLADTGKVVIKQSGEVRLSFSLRDEYTLEGDVVIMKAIVAKQLPEATIKTLNMLRGHHPEYRVTVIIKPS